MIAARARTYQGMGILFRFHAFPEETMGKYCLVEALVPPGLGAPPNHHAGETEAFFVLNGAASFTVDGATLEVGAGGYLAIPDGAVHSFHAIGPEPARLLIINAPGHMHEAFFTGTGEPVDEGTLAPAPMDGPPDVARILQVASDCGMVILPPPRH